MFNLFRKKEPSLKVIDKIWMTETAKFQSIADEWKKDNSIHFIFWFDDTLQRASDFLAAQNTAPHTFFTAREISNHSGSKIIFAEHNPLQQKEKDLFEKLNLEEVTVWSSLDEPLFKHFGGDKIVGMMKQLGMKESESVEHKMISKSIVSAQEKIADKVQFEQSARSQKEWLEKNLPV